jgi:hypothetical protein
MDTTTVTVVLEHPQHAELSSVVFQSSFKEEYPALRCYHDLAKIYTERQYTVCLDRGREFSLERHIDHLNFIRRAKKTGEIPSV